MSKDFKDLIKIADVYGADQRKLYEDKEAQLMDEGWFQDLMGFVKDKLGMNDAAAAEIATDVQKKTGANPEDKDLSTAQQAAKDYGGDIAGGEFGGGSNPNAQAGVDGADQGAAQDQANAGVDGAADAAAKAPAGLDVTTPNLMKAYNAGGKKPMDNIKAMQTALQKAGHDPKGIDGKYGPGTFAAVKAFQTAQGLKADGQAGPNTMKALQKATGGGAAPAKADAKPSPAATATANANQNAQTAAAGTTGPDGNPEVDAQQAAASQQGIDGGAQAAATSQATAGVDGADQAELDAGAGQANNKVDPALAKAAADKAKKDNDPMSAANQAKDRKTDRQQMAAEAVNEASMNISMNGTDAREVAELVGILKNAGMEEPDAKIMAIKHMPSMSPMDRMDRDPMMGPMDKPSPCGEDDEAEYQAILDDWDNSPDPEYKDDDYMLKDLAGGINKPKKSYPATQLGDNPMSVREALWNALQDKYRTDEGSRGKKKKSRGAMEDVETTEGSRGKKKKSRGAMEEASRGKKKKSRGAMEDIKTTEGSRGKKSRGKSSRG